MLTEVIGAIFYSLDFTQTDERLCCRVSVASSMAAPEGATLLRSISWRCRLPDPNEYVQQPYGSSETIGLIGGVSHPLRAAQSGAIERALGDGLTQAFAHLLDMGEGVSLVLIRGPAFPKALGRFLSLRLPSSIKVAWVSPLSASSSAFEANASTGLAWTGPRGINLDADGLLSSFGFPLEKPRWLVEFLDVDSSTERVMAVSESLSHLFETHFIAGHDEPRELAFAQAGLLPHATECFTGPETTEPDWFDPPSTLVGARLSARKRPIHPWAVSP
jgi:hypothetical protein